MDAQARCAFLAGLRALFPEPDFRITCSSGSYFCVCYPRCMEHGEITIDVSSPDLDAFVAWKRNVYDFWNFEPGEPDATEAIAKKARDALIGGTPVSSRFGSRR